MESPTQHDFSVSENPEVCMVRFVELKEEERQLVARLKVVRREMRALEYGTLLVLDKREEAAVEAVQEVHEAQQKLDELPPPPSPPLVPMSDDPTIACPFTVEEREHEHKVKEYDAVRKVREKALQDAKHKFSMETAVPVEPKCPQDEARFGAKGVLRKKVVVKRESLNKRSIRRMLSEYLKANPLHGPPSETYITNAVTYLYQHRRSQQHEVLQRVHAKKPRAKRRRTSGWRGTPMDIE